MAELISVNKYCLEHGVDPISFLKLMRFHGHPVYKVGSTYFVDSMDVVNKALILDHERRSQIASKKSAIAKKRADRAKLERQLVQELEIRGVEINAANLAAMADRLSNPPTDGDGPSGPPASPPPSGGGPPGGAPQAGQPRGGPPSPPPGKQSGPAPGGPTGNQLGPPPGNQTSSASAQTPGVSDPMTPGQRNPPQQASGGQVRPRPVIPVAPWEVGFQEQQQQQQQQQQQGRVE